MAENELNITRTRGGRKTYTEMELFFLGRISFLNKLKKDLIGINPSDYGVRLVNKALFSTFQDCKDLGIDGEAKALMDIPQASTNKP